MDSNAVLRLTATQLQGMLTDGKLSCMNVVDMYLAQIQKHNKQGMKLNAVIETAPTDFLKWQAAVSDAQRRAGQVRSALHGIPIIVKDNICTPSLQMRTTLGSFAFRDCVGTRDGVVIDRLIEAGMIVIGKANLSELGNMKGKEITGGWSPVGGQTQSPYVRGGVTANAKWLGQSTPMGSSSGSAVSVAAGFSPFSVGTETDGSVVQPATRAALYAMKLKCETVDGRGMQAAAPALDSPGGFAKTVEDLAALLSVLSGRPELTRPMTASWRGITIGFLDVLKWQFPEDICESIEEVRQQIVVETNQARKKIEEAGCRVVDIDFPLPDEIFAKYKVVPIAKLMAHAIRGAFEGFMTSDLAASVKTLEDLMKFNTEHAQLELPPGKDNQQVLETAANDTMTDQEHDAAFPKTRHAMRHAVRSALEAAGVDILMAPGDSIFPTVAATAGYPIAHVPLGFLDYNGRSFGSVFVASEERKLLEVMAAWEKTFPNARKPPTLLEQWEDTSL